MHRTRPPEPGSGRGIVLRDTRVSPIAVVAGVGAIWGVVGFAVLWGYTSIQVTRPFVQSVPGLLVLLPVRTVLFAIHLVEDRLVGRPFDLSANHDWIGLVSATAGAMIATAVYLLFRAASRVRPRRRPGQG
jgi:hypothetical protein